MNQIFDIKSSFVSLAYHWNEIHRVKNCNKIISSKTSGDAKTAIFLELWLMHTHLSELSSSCVVPAASFNSLSVLISRYLSAKNGQGILSCELMDRECNWSLPSYVNGKCVHEGKLQKNVLVYEVRCSMRETLYIGKTQHTFKKIIEGHFSKMLSLPKNRQKWDSFADHFEQHFKSTTSRTDLCKCMTFKLVKQFNPIGARKTFMKPDFNLCMNLW